MLRPKMFMIVIQQLFRLSNQSLAEAQRGGLGIREGYCGCAHS